MSITTYMPYEPTTGQWVAIQKLGVFFDNDADEIFVLQGYAGTGKTTLIQGVLDYLDAQKRPYRLMASTGRAARVLSNKTGRVASTIHSSIYVVDAQNSEVTEQKKSIAFKLRPNLDDKETIYFIDEASMIADRSETNQQLLFDDGRFLDHIFRFVGRRKIIFIGDNAQLPPVNCNFSAALDSAYLAKQYRKKVIESSLTEVKRQAEIGGIIENATQLREKLFSGAIPPLSLAASMWTDVVTPSNIWSAVSKYTRQIQAEGNDKSVLITLSNGSAHYLNSQVRNGLFRRPNPTLQKNEWLMVIQNNYSTGYNNGQHLRLLSFSDTGEKVGAVSLMDAETEDTETGKTQNVKIIKDLLYCASPGLSIEEDKAFTIDFAQRMKRKNIKPGSDLFLQYMISDKRFNALRVKFGYAITCHKAQGGEWNSVYVQIEPAFGKLPRENQYRWLYTAITRASKCLVIPQHPIIY
jgi:hypothetical protein